MTENGKPISLVWLRRDLRLHDHAALYHALEEAPAVQPVFIFDTDVLARFANPSDRRLTFLAEALCQIHSELEKRGGGLLVLHGRAAEIIPKLSEVLSAACVYAAEDYEPPARARDAAVGHALGRKFVLVKDQVIFAPHEIVKGDATPYKVFTPFSKAWLARLTPASSAPFTIKDKGRYAPIADMRKLAVVAGLRALDPARGAKAMLSDIGYREIDLPLWPVGQLHERLQAFIAAKVAQYKTKRDMVSEEGTSRLSPYLRFGLVSVRECLAAASHMQAAGAWINELIWREFYAMILYHYPESMTKEWNPAWRGLNWSQDERMLAVWKEGKTGYPLVDAAMRQLLTTGWMHNRARMVVASFLTKDLQIDWRRGEEHFAEWLMDYDMASNVGGWQWAASTGTDAQPWFRIFNPVLQSRKFDPDGAYIRRYVPELRNMGGEDIHEPWRFFKPADYPHPIVDHKEAREKTLAMFRRLADAPERR